MKLLLHRYYDSGDDTLGILYYRDKNKDVRFIYTVEDEYREIKVHGETRIPQGFYNLKLRKFGKFYDRYCKSSIEIIRAFTQKWGVLEIENVQGFGDILIHTGNSERDSSGCVIVGDNTNNNSAEAGVVGASLSAYGRLIGSVDHWLSAGEKYTIEIEDFDKAIGRLV